MNQNEKEKFDSSRTSSPKSSLTPHRLIVDHPLLLYLMSFSGFIFYFLFREKQKQKELAKAPLLFFQETDQNVKILQGMDAILFRKITPKLFVGTNSLLNSIMACTYRIDNSGSSVSKLMHYTVREAFTVPSDGATIGIDWEVPQNIDRKEILHGPISKPVLLIIHGFNNDTSTAYIRNVMSHCAKHGFIVAAMNLRGCGNVELTTPRGSTAAYTGDIRSIVQIVEPRLKLFSKPLILIGYSMGANLVTKYLGEESLANSLPKCIAAGISLANPLCVEPGNITFPFSMLLTLGMRKTLLSHWKWLSPMMKNDSYFRKAIYNLFFKCWNISKTDEYTSLYMIRNEARYPFQTQIGYVNPNEYRVDTRSYNHIRNITVPLLNISAMDDFLVHETTMLKLGHSFLANPNIVACMTYTGGHLGWFEDNGRSWADDAVLSYIKTISSMYEDKILKNGTSEKIQDESNRNIFDDLQSYHTEFIYSKL